MTNAYAAIAVPHFTRAGTDDGDQKPSMPAAISKPAESQRLCEAMGRPQLAEDERFCDHTARGAHAGELDGLEVRHVRFPALPGAPEVFFEYLPPPPALALFGAGGPIYATYLSGRLDDKHQLRSTVSTLISISAFSRATSPSIIVT